MVCTRARVCNKDKTFKNNGWITRAIFFVHFVLDNGAKFVNLTTRREKRLRATRDLYNVLWSISEEKLPSRELDKRSAPIKSRRLPHSVNTITEIIAALHVRLGLASALRFSIVKRRSHLCIPLAFQTKWVPRTRGFCATRDAN